MIATLEGDRVVLPGLASAHSHAFQRALRGRAQRRGGGSFWSWRGLMYELASSLDPETIHAISRYAFVELAQAGVTAVGEFHYVHHQPDGTPYGERTALADAVIRAALDAGIRVTLLRVLYHRAGHDRALEPTQRRFVDARLDDALRDVEALIARYADEPRVRVGLAPHSVRAAPREWIVEAARFARERELPFHMHVSEQRREIDECLDEHGKRPVAMLADAGVLGPQFVGVHATHLDDDELRAFGAAGSFACICRTTERDLGDGSPRTQELVDAGARLCFGVDSHAISDPFEEARAVELDERTRLERRAVFEAPELVEAASKEGYAAIGLDGLEREDRVTLDPRAAPLLGLDPATLDDAVIFAATPACVDEVVVAGETIVSGGQHVRLVESRDTFVRALSSM